MCNRAVIVDNVSTHSHPKVAAMKMLGGRAEGGVSTHSHPKVAARSRKRRNR